jgi:phospholipase/carboxylesterase
MSTRPSLLDCVEVETGSDPTHAVIWLHGLGADGHNFAPIVAELKLPASLAVRFVFPHAPVRPVTIRGGVAMRAWYDILGQDLVNQEDVPDILASESALRQLIARENARGIPNTHIVLAGFSQGCAITLHTGLRLDQKLAGMVGLSGYVPLIDRVAAERNPGSVGTPIFLAHGIYDAIVELPRAQQSRACLEQLGYTLAWHTYPMQHSVCAEEVADISRFLCEVFELS